MKNKIEDNAFGQIVGRDNQIIREALSIAIPMMLRHSLAWSNTKDMMRILETLGRRTPTNLIQGRELKEKIIEVSPLQNKLFENFNELYIFRMSSFSPTIIVLDANKISSIFSLLNIAVLR